MISYHVFFSPRAGVDDAAVIAAARQFLESFRSAGKLQGFRILRVTNSGSFPALLRFQAIVDYASQADLDESFEFMRAPGAIHQGGHGALMSLVSDFKVSFTADV